MTITTNSGGEGDRAGWVEWHGGECPVSPDAPVEYRKRGDHEALMGWLTNRASNCRWNHAGWDTDIIAYRVVSPVAGEGQGSSSPKSEDTQPGSADRWADLERLARAATQGPWIRSGCRRKMGDEDCIMVGPDGFLIAALPIGKPREHAAAFTDAGFIAAANPAAVLELIAAARGVRGGDEGSQSRSEPDTAHRSAEGAVVGWQPIETAPADRHEQVLLIAKYPHGQGWSDIYHSWSQAPYGKGWAVHWARWPHSFGPTHWMPLPAPPASDTTARDFAQQNEPDTSTRTTGEAGQPDAALIPKGGVR